jgi:hypothetical protein
MDHIGVSVEGGRAMERPQPGDGVVEASATSGAKIRASLALQHGKRVFLPTSTRQSQALTAIAAEPWHEMSRDPSK